MAGKGFTVRKNWDNPAEHAMPAEARVPAEMRLGQVLVAPATVLAPMAGVTDTVFRRFIRHASLFSAGGFNESHPNGNYNDAARVGHPEIEGIVTNAQSGCGLLMTEFTSADGLARMRESKRQRYLTFYDDEHPIGAQLFGANPETLAEAARIVEETGFDLVDLNLGCPAKRVVGSQRRRVLICRADDEDAPPLGEFPSFHPEQAAQIENRDNLATHVGHAADKARDVGNQRGPGVSVHLHHVANRDGIGRTGEQKHEASLALSGRLGGTVVPEREIHAIAEGGIRLPVDFGDYRVKTGGDICSL